MLSWKYPIGDWNSLQASQLKPRGWPWRKQTLLQCYLPDKTMWQPLAVRPALFPQTSRPFYLLGPGDKLELPGHSHKDEYHLHSGSERRSCPKPNPAA